jgi:hypothetical protein
MRGREKIRGTGGVGLIALALLAVLLSGLLATPAVAKKKKQRPPATTVSAAVPLAPSSPASTTANCPGKTHVTGGGWSIASPYSANGTDAPADDTGTRITHLQSQPSALSSWTSGVAALAIPPSGTTFTTYARCESNTYGRTLFGVSGTSTVPIGQETTSILHCPNGTHVLTGGFSFTPPGDLSGDLASKRAMVVESRRIAPDSWEIDLVNPTGAPAEATISLNVLCELNKKGSTVTEASSVVPIGDNGRTAATASCTGKTHAVAGGFLISPTVGPAIGIDQMQPAGNKAWQVALFEYPTFALPAGSSLAAYSYCKKNALPKKGK